MKSSSYSLSIIFLLLLVSLISPTIVVSSSGGDPQFFGFRDQSFQFHGHDGQVYSIISDSLIQVNARFDYLDQGQCPEYIGASRSLPVTNCWSRSGLYFGLITIQTNNGDRVMIDAGSAFHGFQSVMFNDRDLTIADFGLDLYGKNSTTNGSNSDSDNDNDTEGDSQSSTLLLQLLDPHHLVIRAGLFTLSIDNSDMFINIGEVHVNDWSRLVNKIQSHGILGQTWKLLKGGKNEKGQEIPEIEGMVDDYLDANNDVWGIDNIYNKFTQTNKQSK